MEWRAQGTLLSVRRHGESAAIIEVFTEAQGRHLGVVPGGAGRRLAPMLQPGAVLDCSWRARLEGQLGTFAVEPLQGRAAALMGDRAGLAGLVAVCALLSAALPERAPYPALWRASNALLDLIGTVPDWPTAYLRWELGLLQEIGYGLDLSRCAVTGMRHGLAYVSPRTGRAVSSEGAGDWADRLLPLPACLMGRAPVDGAELAVALAVTGHFLDRHLGADRPLPPARARLVAALARWAPPG
jgi:DNA repair protein RecO (recombination protein O)